MYVEKSVTMSSVELRRIDSKTTDVRIRGLWETVPGNLKKNAIEYREFHLVLFDLEMPTQSFFFKKKNSV